MELLEQEILGILSNVDWRKQKLVDWQINVDFNRIQKILSENSIEK